MRKKLALLLSFALLAATFTNTAISARASEGSSDDPYKLIMTEEPKPSSGSRKSRNLRPEPVRPQVRRRRPRQQRNRPQPATTVPIQAIPTREPAATRLIPIREPAATRATLIRAQAEEIPARRLQRRQNLLQMLRTMFPSPVQTRSIR